MTALAKKTTAPLPFITSSFTVPSVADIRVQTMKLKDWAALPVFFTQRNHAARILKDKHRSRFNKLSPTHLVVSAVVMPDGLTYKVDGHTRTEAWKLDKAEKPSEVMVIKYHVKNGAEARAIYDMIDNRAPVKTGSDTIFSVMRDAGFDPSSAFILECGYNMALNVAFGTANKGYSKVQQVHDALPYLRMLDTINPNKNRFRVAIFAAALMTLRLDGTKALVFWDAYQKGKFEDGSRTNAHVVVAEFDKLLAEEEIGGTTKQRDATGKLLAIYQVWRENRDAILSTSHFYSHDGLVAFDVFKAMIK